MATRAEPESEVLEARCLDRRHPESGVPPESGERVLVGDPHAASSSPERSPSARSENDRVNRITSRSRYAGRGPQ